MPKEHIDQLEAENSRLSAILAAVQDDLEGKASPNLTHDTANLVMSTELEDIKDD